jgi:hypothetical protein
LFEFVRPKQDDRDTSAEGNHCIQQLAAAVRFPIVAFAMPHESCSREVQNDSDRDRNHCADDRDGIRKPVPVRHRKLDG